MQLQKARYSYPLPSDNSPHPNLVNIYTPPELMDRKTVLVFAYGLGKEFSQYNENFVHLVNWFCQKVGLTVVTFDYRGVGKHQKFGETTLADRAEDTMSVLLDLPSRYKRSQYFHLLAGHSAGGAVVARISAQREVQGFVDGMILSAPAVYHPDAWYVPFGQHFTEVLRRPHSYKKSLEPEIFRNFRGYKGIITCAGDDVVTWQKTKLYIRRARKDTIHRVLDKGPLGHKVFDHRERTLGLGEIMDEMIHSPGFGEIARANYKR